MDQSASQAHDPPTQPHLRYIDGLRALAALYVLAYHDLYNTPQYQNAWWAFPINQGHLAVDLFIVISGFCLMLPVIANGGNLRGGLKRFFVRRATRILPPYYYSIIFSLLLIHFFIGGKTGTGWDLSVPVRPTAIPVYLLLLQDFFGNVSAINYVYWSIAVEWHIYFVFPLMIMGRRRFGPIGLAAFVTAVSFAVNAVIKHGPLMMITPGYYALFTFGMLAASVATGDDPRLRVFKEAWVLALLGAASAAFVIWQLLLPLDKQRVGLIDIFAGIACCMLVIAASRQGFNPIRTALSWKPLASLGLFAYSIYLVHAPLLQLLWQYGVHPLHLSSAAQCLVDMFVVGPLTVILAYLFFRLCEKPWLKGRSALPSTQTETVQA